MFWIQLMVQADGAWVSLRGAGYSTGGAGHDRFDFTLHLIIDNLPEHTHLHPRSPTGQTVRGTRTARSSWYQFVYRRETCPPHKPTWPDT